MQPLVWQQSHLSKGVEAAVPCHARCRDIEDWHAPRFFTGRTDVVKFNYYVFASASLRAHTRCCIRRSTQASRIGRAAINGFGTCRRLLFPARRFCSLFTERCPSLRREVRHGAFSLCRRSRLLYVMSSGRSLLLTSHRSNSKTSDAGRPTHLPGPRPAARNSQKRHRGPGHVERLVRQSTADTRSGSTTTRPFRS